MQHCMETMQHRHLSEGLWLGMDRRGGSRKCGIKLMRGYCCFGKVREVGEVLVGPLVLQPFHSHSHMARAPCAHHGLKAPSEAKCCTEGFSIMGTAP